MKIARDIPFVGRKAIALLTAESFEEERILNMIEEVIQSGGVIEMETDQRAMTAKFEKKEQQ